MRLLLPTALLAILLMAAGATAQRIGSNYTVEYANLTLASASAYVDSVNQSAYLIFYPNLTQAYAYLGKAKATYNTSPASSVLYAQEARSSAMAQYLAISGYRKMSFAVMAALTVASAAAVLVSMRKATGSRSRHARRRS